MKKKKGKKMTKLPKSSKEPVSLYKWTGTKNKIPANFQ